MRILHTSDLHLGKNLMEESFYEDQKYILKEIIDIIKLEKIEVILIAGDIYDKNIPSVSAVNLFNDFLDELSKINAKVIMISGNHDSNDRLSFGSNLFNKLNICIDAIYSGKMQKYSIENVDIYALPFIKPFHLKNFMSSEQYEKITSANEMMKWVLSQEKLDKSRKNILVAHQFFMNEGAVPDLSESESISNVGTLDAIDVNLLDDFDYVALGHIHKPQKIKRDTIRYSGTPIKYSFSEVNNKNHVVIYNTENNDVKLVELKPLRNMRILKGTFDEVMNMEPSNDLIRVELEDENTIISPMDRIKKRFPNALSMVFVNKQTSNDKGILLNSINSETSPLILFNNFYSMQNEKQLSEKQDKYMKELINKLEGEE